LIEQYKGLERTMWNEKNKMAAVSIFERLKFEVRNLNNTDFTEEDKLNCMLTGIENFLGWFFVSLDCDENSRMDIVNTFVHTMHSAMKFYEKTKEDTYVCNH